jgi:hypothetical protein
MPRELQLKMLDVISHLTISLREQIDGANIDALDNDIEKAVEYLQDIRKRMRE